MCRLDPLGNGALQASANPRRDRVCCAELLCYRVACINPGDIGVPAPARSELLLRPPRVGLVGGPADAKTVGAHFGGVKPGGRSDRQLFGVTAKLVRRYGHVPRGLLRCPVPRLAGGTWGSPGPTFCPPGRGR